MGNAISAFSLALDRFLGMVKEQHDAVELRLALGATRWEATLPFCRAACVAGLTPNLNQMSVTGLVAIPGMMTGQILGGASPFEAAKCAGSSLPNRPPLLPIIPFMPPPVPSPLLLSPCPT